MDCKGMGGIKQKITGGKGRNEGKRLLREILLGVYHKDFSREQGTQSLSA
jgi:hypothetical protein